MNAEKLQQKVYGGYAKAARRIGPDFDLYRPTSAVNPLDQANNVTTLPASFNNQDMTYSKPDKYGSPLWYVLVDGTQTQVGDYLTREGQTFFIAGQDTILPILAVECTRTVSIFRPGQPEDVGVQPYGGDIDATETALMTGWPASVLQGTKGDKENILPGDTRTPWWAILLPAWPGVILRGGDVMTDDIERRYVISSAELTDHGWRITATQGQT